MLVLTRRPGNALRVYLGDELIAEVKVISVSGKKVRVGVNADQQYRIVRGEIDESKDEVVESDKYIQCSPYQGGESSFPVSE